MDSLSLVLPLQTPVCRLQLQEKSQKEEVQHIVLTVGTYLLLGIWEPAYNHGDMSKYVLPSSSFIQGHWDALGPWVQWLTAPRANPAKDKAKFIRASVPHSLWICASLRSEILPL